MSAKPPLVLVVVEHDAGVLRRSSRRHLCVPAGWPMRPEVVAIAFGDGAGEAARASLAAGAARAHWLSDPDWLPLRWLRALVNTVETLGVDGVLFSESVLGRDLAPRLAARMQAAYFPNASDVAMSGEGLLVTRALMSGRFLESCIWPAHTLAVMTWCGSGREPFPGTECVGPAVLQAVDVPSDPLDLRVCLRAARAQRGGDLREADVVVCGGRGVGSREGFGLVYRLADALGGEPAASRAAVDAGFAPPELQVGQSGKSVQPRFYFALGVSGSLQHRAGMQNSRCVIAVNSDPAAPMLQWADYGVVGDLHRFVPALIDALKKRV